ncbi:aldo/keto reductase [Rubrivirga sp. IMCC45206]|uniref:aldo/keto reductase n=1 Tax=Rubrivirga sp. IMCC45206 TaxID=3391614 RepID=UPI00399006D3
MTTTSLGALTTSRLAYGCMTLGGLDRPAAEAAVDAALDGGVTLFDHADIYSGGRSETLFGEILADRPGLRDRVVLQTKCGIRFADAHGPKRYNLGYDHIVASVEGSLRRLGTDRVEVLLLHRPDPLAEPTEIARAFDSLAAAGKVGAFGVSNFSVAQLDRLAAAVDQPLVANQIQLSLGHIAPVEAGVEVNTARSVSGADDLLDGCAARGARLQAWAPTAGGSFSRGDVAPEHADVAEAVRAVAGDRGATPLQVVLAFVLRLPHSVQPVFGSTNPGRIAEACAATGVSLPREAWYRLYEAARGKRVP